MTEQLQPDLVTAPKWDRQYAEPDYIFGTEPNTFLVAQAHRFASAGRILVPGDGEGRNGVWLASQGFAVTSIEASAVGIEKARALAKARGARIDQQHANLQDWDWPVGTFDGAASIFVHFVPTVRQYLHRRMFAALKPGGVIVLESFTPRHVLNRKAGGRGGPPPEMLYDVATLREDFSGAVFDILEECDAPLDEGSRHTGTAAIVRMVARKAA